MTTLNRNAVTAAVKRLRLALGDTQQQFATRTGLAISTVVRYELSRPPKGEVLEQLKALAEQNGLRDIATVFSYALGGQDLTPETAALNSAIASLWWNRKALADWPKLARCLADQLRNLIDVKRKQPDEVPESIEELETQLVQLRSALFGAVQDEINSEASKILEEKSGLSWERAQFEALTRNPELYQRYLAERAKAAMGTQFEESLSTPASRNRKKDKK